MAAQEVIPYFPGVTGKILDLIAQDGQHWGIHACQTFPVGYNLPNGTDPPPDTIAALTSATVLSTGFLNGRTTFDPTVGNWVIVTVPSTRGLWATPLEEVGKLPTLVAHDYFAILAWCERGVVRPWQWTISNPLPPPTAKGNILRANEDAGGNLYWEQYALAAGSQNAVLLDDLANSDLPIWEPLSALAALVAPLVQPNGPPLASGTRIGSRTGPGGLITSVKVTSLWSDNANANAPAPSYWQNLNFDDHGWDTPQDVTATIAGDGFTAFPGTRAIWRFTVATTGERCLFRTHFTPPLGSVSSLHLQCENDDQNDGIYLNGYRIFDGGGPVQSDVSFNGPLSPTLITPGADNVLAVSCTNIYPPHAFLCFVLVIN